MELQRIKILYEEWRIEKLQNIYICMNWKVPKYLVLNFIIEYFERVTDTILEDSSLIICILQFMYEELWWTRSGLLDRYSIPIHEFNISSLTLFQKNVFIQAVQINIEMLKKYYSYDTENMQQVFRYIRGFYPKSFEEKRLLNIDNVRNECIKMRNILKYYAERRPYIMLYEGISCDFKDNILHYLQDKTILMEIISFLN